jgi:hypothetical protein
MSCSDCGQTISTSDIINKSLEKWRKFLIPGDRTQNNRPDTVISLSSERLDMAAYTFIYHMEYGCALEKDPFWGNIYICELLLKYRFEEYSASHSMSCFKKGCECRFLFPFLSAKTVHTFMRTEVRRMKKKHCFIHEMDQELGYIPVLFYQKDPWVAST